MRTFIYFTVSFFVLASVSCQSSPDYVTVQESKLDKYKIASIKQLGHEILTAQKNNGYYSLTKKQATTQMIEGLNESVQKASYKKIKSLFGDYEDLQFKSLLRGLSGEKYMIYRFKGNFKTDADIEVRMVFNEEEKLAGFFIKPWNESL